MTPTWSATLGYRNCRPPYLGEFFEDVARRLPLAGSEHLLDLGSGTGDVALGMSPYVGSVTAIEPEAPMLEEIANRARKAGTALRLIQSTAETAPLELGPFDVITIGRAHWFMHTPATLARIDRWLRPGGSVVLCGPSDTNIGGTQWGREYAAIRRSWERGDLRARMSLTPAQFFAGTAFEEVDEVATFGEQTIDLDHLLNRALGHTGTTRALLGADADRMLAELREAMAPYFRHGPLVERLCTVGSIHRRRTDR